MKKDQVELNVFIHYWNNFCINLACVHWMMMTHERTLKIISMWVISLLWCLYYADGQIHMELFAMRTSHAYLQKQENNMFMVIIYADDFHIMGTWSSETCCCFWMCGIHNKWLERNFSKEESANANLLLFVLELIFPVE